MKPRIAVIEADRRTRRLINNLLGQKYSLSFAENFIDGYALAVNEGADVIIIDPLYPSKEGLQLIAELAGWSDIPVLALSQNGTERAAVMILEAGACDFIRKPFFSDEFVTRVSKAIETGKRLKASRGISLAAGYKNGDLVLDFEKRELTLKGAPIHLTRNEYKIFELLCKNSGKVLTYNHILQSVWGPRTDSNTGILRVNITNLRKKLEQDGSKKYLLTENGVGLKVKENEI